MNLVVAPHEAHMFCHPFLGLVHKHLQGSSTPGYKMISSITEQSSFSILMTFPSQVFCVRYLHGCHRTQMCHEQIIQMN